MGGRIIHWCPKGCGKQVHYKRVIKIDKNKRIWEYLCINCGTIFLKEDLDKFWGEKRMKIETNCPKCLEIVISEKDFIGCYICPKCSCIIAKEVL